MKKEEITNRSIKCRFRNIESLSDIWRKIQDLFLECIVRLKEEIYLPLLLIVIADKNLEV